MGGMEFKKRDIALCLLCSIPLLPFNLLRTGVRAQQRRMKERKRRRQETRPPKPIRHIPDLALPPEEESYLKGIAVSRKKRRALQQQTECGLFKLPPEIRRMVYEQYVGSAIAIVDRQSALHPRRRRVRKSRHDKMAIGVRVKKDRNGREGGRPVDVLSLLMSCRRIYSELHPLLYTTPTFSFFSPDTFLLFATTLSPSSFSALRSLRLSFTSRYSSALSDSRFASSSSSTSTSTSAYPYPPGTPVTLHSPISFAFLYRPAVRVRNNPFPAPPGRFIGSGAAAKVLWPPDIWNVLCTVLSKMSGLKKLAISVKDSHFDPRIWEAKKELCVLEPLEMVIRPTALRVEIQQAKFEWVVWPDTYITHRARYERVLDGGQVWKETFEDIITEIGRGGRQTRVVE